MNWANRIMGCVSEYIDQRGKNMGGYITVEQAQNAMQAAQQQAQLQNQYAQQQAALGNAWNQASISGGGYASQQAKEKPITLGAYHLTNNAAWTFDELNDEGSVYNMTLQTAVDLAINKFGSGWFKDEATTEALEENKDFWLKVMHKLFNNKRLVREDCYEPGTFMNVVAWKILDEDHGNS